MKCSADRCGTGVPPKRPFCTDHMKKLPYKITKDFWGPERESAIQNAKEYLKELEAA